MAVQIIVQVNASMVVLEGVKMDAKQHAILVVVIHAMVVAQVVVLDRPMHNF